MNFPMDSPLMQFLYWLVNIPGHGGVLVALIAGGTVLTYTLTFYWIRQGREADEEEVYVYPTSALHTHDTE